MLAGPEACGFPCFPILILAGLPVGQRRQLQRFDTAREGPLKTVKALSTFGRLFKDPYFLVPVCLFRLGASCCLPKLLFRKSLYLEL